MAANFNEPTVSTTYTDFPTQIIDNIDAALQQLSIGSPSNIPTGAIKWHSGQNRWKKYNGSSFDNLTDTYNLAAAVNATQLNLGDDEAVRLGNSQDFQLFHRSSDGVSLINETGGGYLSIGSNGSRIEMYDIANARTMAEFHTGDRIELKFAATTRIATTNSGANITGNLNVSGSADFGDDLEIDGSDNAGKHLKIGTGRTGNSNSFVDLIGDATYTTYGARFIRSNSGANANTHIQHRGTGAFNLTAVDAGPINLNTSNAAKVTVTSGGPVGVGLTNPTFRFQVFAGTSFACKIGTSVNGANLQLADNDTISQFRTVDGALRLEADINNAIDNSEMRFHIDGSEKMVIKDTGFVGINVSNPQTRLQINSPAGNTNDANIRLHNGDPTMVGGQSVGRLEFSSADASNSGVGAVVEATTQDTSGNFNLRFLVGTGGATLNEAARFDANGRLLIGRTSQVNSRVGNANIQPEIQIHGDSQGAMSISRYVDGTSSSRLHLQKGRGTAASPANINTSDNLGEITFSGYHGSNYRNGARIRARCASASNSMPSDLLFEITNDAGSLTQNMILTHDRFVGINDGSPEVSLHVKQLADNAGAFVIEDSGANARRLTVDVTDAVTSFKVRSNNSFGHLRFQRSNGTTTNENCRVANDGQFLIGTTTSITNARLVCDGGDISTNAQVIAGRGNGGVALTHNDGGGNANVCWNHTNQVPEQNGKSGRIAVNTDNTGNVATMSIGLKHNSSSGSSGAVTAVMELHRGPRENHDNAFSGDTTVVGQIRADGTTSNKFPAYSFIDNPELGICRLSNNVLGFVTGGNARVRIGSNSFKFEQGTDGTFPSVGEVGVGNTQKGVVLKPRDGIQTISGEGLFQLAVNANRNAAGVIISIRKNGNQQGSIQNTSGSGVTYSSASDYRLKEDAVEITDGIAKIKELKPYNFKWKEGKIDDIGFFAHELQSICSQAVSGTKDEVDADKNPIYQQVDQAKLIPFLVSAVKSLIAKVEVLEAA